MSTSKPGFKKERSSRLTQEGQQGEPRGRPGASPKSPDREPSASRRGPSRRTGSLSGPLLFEGLDDLAEGLLADPDKTERIPAGAAELNKLDTGLDEKAEGGRSLQQKAKDARRPLNPPASRLGAIRLRPGETAPASSVADSTSRSDRSAHAIPGRATPDPLSRLPPADDDDLSVSQILSVYAQQHPEAIADPHQKLRFNDPVPKVPLQDETDAGEGTSTEHSGLSQPAGLPVGGEMPRPTPATPSQAVSRVARLQVAPRVEVDHGPTTGATVLAALAALLLGILVFYALSGSTRATDWTHRRTPRELLTVPAPEPTSPPDVLEMSSSSTSGNLRSAPAPEQAPSVRVKFDRGARTPRESMPLDLDGLQTLGRCSDTIVIVGRAGDVEGRRRKKKLALRRAQSLYRVLRTLGVDPGRLRLEVDIGSNRPDPEVELHCSAP